MIGKITPFDEAQSAVDFLNSLLKIDPVAINTLIQTRVRCNKELAEHDRVTVIGCLGERGEQINYIGILGILNGLYGWHDKDTDIDIRIVAVVDDNEVKKFEVIDWNKQPKGN